MQIGLTPQVGTPQSSQGSVERRTREGLSNRRIRRVLKRHVARQIYRTLAATDPAPQPPLVA